MRALKFIPQYTVNDYQHWEGDWELIDGLAYAMSPSAVRGHQSLSGELFTQISIALKKEKTKCGDCEVVYELDWIIDNNTVVRPDIAIICGQQEDFITSPPVLVVEILSPSTAHKDRHVKFEIYQEQGVKYYIMADPETKAYNIYELINGQYQEQKDLTDFTIHGECQVHIDIEQALAAL